MKLNIQKRLSAEILKCSQKRITFDPERLDEIKEAITKADIRGLIKDGTISCKPKRGISKYKARKIKQQKRKERQKGHGSRKGKKTARLSKKDVWMNKIRAQRNLLKKLRDNRIVSKKTYRLLYAKTKGGFFRSVRHIKLYIEEHNLITRK